MKTIIDAIVNLANNPVTDLRQTSHANNRANAAGDALEEYVKDLFADSFGMAAAQRNERLNEVFSYLGNNSNPPDAMLKGGDAIEVKKIKTDNAALALNSSHPKHTLRADNPMLSAACRRAENWNEKDMLYVVGVVDDDDKLRHLAMVYGLDYCADESRYLGLRQRIVDGVSSSEGVEFSETKELGHVNKIDPLGITYLRVRGMWGIENPWTAFDYVYERDMAKRFNFMCLVNERKWRTLPDVERVAELAERDERLVVSDVRIKDPNNPARLNNAKLIGFSF